MRFCSRVDPFRECPQAKIPNLKSQIPNPKLSVGIWDLRFEILDYGLVFGPNRWRGLVMRSANCGQPGIGRLDLCIVSGGTVSSKDSKGTKKGNERKVQ